MVYDYIEKYAIAQSILGIDKAITIKEKVIGKEPLAKANINELDKIVRILRKQYLNSKFFKGEKKGR